MRQAVAFARAIHKRDALNKYFQVCLSATAAGGKVTKTFDEMFPAHAEQETLAISAEQAKLMNDIAKQDLAEMEEAYGVAE